MELIAASTLAIVVLLAMGQVDFARLHLMNRLRGTSLSEAMMALAHLGRNIEQADRINLLSATNVQLRIPDFDSGGVGCPAPNCTGAVPAACCLDIAGNYRWVQYRFDAVNSEIRFYNDTNPATGGNCLVDNRFQGVSALSLQYSNVVAAPPPGGDPTGLSLAPPQDNNLLEIAVTSTVVGGSSNQYRDDVMIRSGAYTNVLTGLSTVNGPPASCP